MDAEEYTGRQCPSHMQEPYGKTLNISFVGLPPFITYNPIGGSEFLVTNILARKFKFIPNYIPAKSWDTFQENQSTYGMVHQVPFVRLYYSLRNFIVSSMILGCKDLGCKKQGIMNHCFCTIPGVIQESWTRNWTNWFSGLQIWSGWFLACHVCTWNYIGFSKAKGNCLLWHNCYSIWQIYLVFHVQLHICPVPALGCNAKSLVICNWGK